MSQPEQDKPCDCPMCQCGMQFPQVLKVLIVAAGDDSSRDGPDEPQMWRQGKHGNLVPVFVDEVKK